MKNDLTRISLQGAEIGKDFEVISLVAFDKDYKLVPFVDGMKKSDYEEIGFTPFDNNFTKHVYYINKHEIDEELAIALGLGIIKTSKAGGIFLYSINLDEEDYEFELFRMGVYYQLVKPDYDDKKLQQIYFMKSGREFLNSLIMVGYQDMVMNRLGEIFKSKNGKVVSFEKRV